MFFYAVIFFKACEFSWIFLSFDNYIPELSDQLQNVVRNVLACRGINNYTAALRQLGQVFLIAALF